MRRRDFLMTGVGVLASAALRPLVAASARPRVMIFGMSVVENPSLGGTRVWCPGSKVPGIVGGKPIEDVHRTFIVGPSHVVRKLATEVVSTKGSGLSAGHRLLEEYESEDGVMGCLPNGTLKVGGGSADLHDSLPAYLPKLVDVAKACRPSENFKLGDVKKVGECVKVDLGDGVLMPAPDRSKNKGTHGIRWQFHYGADPKGRTQAVGDLYHLTDLLEFESADEEVTLEFGDRKIALKSTERLWVINVPTIGAADGTPNEIEHAHAWTDLLQPTLTGLLEVHAVDKYVRDPSTGQTFQHPCGPRLYRYFPPDTDPCFSVMN